MKTAEEFVEEYCDGAKWSKIMTDFAKYHVQKALESAAEKLKQSMNLIGSGEGESTYINRDSILTAYNLEDIK